MLFTFARVSAVVGMNADDYYQIGKRTWIRLHEKGGKHHEVPTHHTAEEYLDAYLAALPPAIPSPLPYLFTAVGKTGQHSSNRLIRNDALRMIKRRSKRVAACLTRSAVILFGQRKSLPILKWWHSRKRAGDRRARKPQERRSFMIAPTMRSLSTRLNASEFSVYRITCSIGINSPTGCSQLYSGRLAVNGLPAPLLADRVAH